MRSELEFVVQFVCQLELKLRCTSTHNESCYIASSAFVNFSGLRLDLPLRDHGSCARDVNGLHFCSADKDTFFTPYVASLKELADVIRSSLPYEQALLNSKLPRHFPGLLMPASTARPPPMSRMGNAYVTRTVGTEFILGDEGRDCDWSVNSNYDVGFGTCFGHSKLENAN